MLELEYITQEQYDEACKQVDKGIEFKEGEKLTVEQLPIKGSIITQQEATERPYKFYWDIKTLVMRIMKNRRYSIEDRLILLCIAFQKIDGFIVFYRV